MDYIEKYHMIRPYDMVVAGVSGGADSVCLLFVLLEIRKKLPFELKVVHVNHGVREDAGADAEFVRALCEKYGLPFYLREENIKELSARSGHSQEEEGRRVRYQAFAEVLGRDQGRIAVAHNSNDRAETMLFHLFRGTGLSGMCGIRPVNGNIIRPLLGVTREEIEKWLSEKHIPYCTDSTNEQDAYTRNRIRHHILPYAEQEICQGTVVNMNRAADDFLMAEEYLQNQIRKAMERCVQEDKDGIIICIPEFSKEDDYLKGRILLSCVEKAAGVRKDITSAHIKAIERLFGTSGSREIHLPYHLTVYKKYDVGMIQRNDFIKDEIPWEEGEGREYPVSIPGRITVPGLGIVEFTVFSLENSQNIPEKTYTKWFDYDKITSSVVFRTKRTGDYLTVKSKTGMGHKSLQDYFVNEKIPKDERSRIYMLAEDSHILWIPGHRISEYYKISENTRSILQVTILDKEE